MLKIYTDGLVEPVNPGGHGCWGWVAIEEGKEIASASGYLGQGPNMTSNVAEYSAIGHALRWALDTGHTGFWLFSDSQVAVEQIAGRYACRAERLKPYLARVAELVECTRAHVVWIPRIENKRADELTRCEFEKVTGKRPPERVKP